MMTLTTDPSASTAQSMHDRVTCISLRHSHGFIHQKYADANEDADPKFQDPHISVIHPRSMDMDYRRYKVQLTVGFKALKAVLSTRAGIGPY